MKFGKYVVAVKSTKRARWALRALDTLSIGFAALVAGSRSIPLGDNGALLKELAARAGLAGPRAVRALAVGGTVKDR
jgi:hypothetical protein